MTLDEAAPRKRPVGAGAIAKFDRVTSLSVRRRRGDRHPTMPGPSLDFDLFAPDASIKAVDNTEPPANSEVTRQAERKPASLNRRKDDRTGCRVAEEHNAARRVGFGAARPMIEERAASGARG